jgi:predicted alpha/beta superfamily hydrolase
VITVPASSGYLDKWLTRGRSAPGTLDVIPDVYSPELGNHRDIIVYTPASYLKSRRPFPVIYMQDGQNLFDPRTSFAGEWGVDVALARAPRRGRRAIIVGIPNMGVDRMREYSPFHDTRHGGGGGDAYVDFVLQTLKPMIDERYRTRQDPEGTGIVGSSLGGLIALYAFFRSPRAFGFCGAMSPALWFGEGAIFPFIREARYVRGRVYLDVGLLEGPGTLANARAMEDLLASKGMDRSRLMYVEDRHGQHNEAAWGRRLRKALPFLLATEGTR